MKKKLLNLVLCLIGFGMGFLSLLCATTPILELENCVQKIVKSGIKEKRDWIFSSIGNIGIVMLILAIITVVVLAFIRFFANSKCMQKVITFGQVITDIVLSIFVSEVLVYYLNQIFEKRIWSLAGEVGYSIAYVVVYAAIYISMSILLNRSVDAIVRRPKKDCRLSIWQVKNEREFMEIKELIHKQQFNDCYGYMKYQKAPLASMQFYVISEMNWSGKKEVAQWKYYSNGDFIELDDAELRTKLLVAKNAENINWQL